MEQYKQQLIDAFVKANLNEHGYRTSAEWELERRRAFVETAKDFFKDLHRVDQRGLIAKLFRPKPLLVAQGDMAYFLRSSGAAVIQERAMEFAEEIFNQEKIGFFLGVGERYENPRSDYGILQKVTDVNGNEPKMRVEYAYEKYLTKDGSSAPLIVSGLDWNDLVQPD